MTLPLPPGLTQPMGVHQSDIIIRSALIAAIADLRANPWLLDYVFSSLPRDTLTMSDYGEREVTNAKRWFMSTDIPVIMNTRIDDAKLPAISVSLMESTEAETTLADVHYQPTEDTHQAGPVLAGPFTPASYSAVTGIMVLPNSIADELVIAPGMIVVDAINKSFEILEVMDRNTFALKAGSVGEFVGATIKGSNNAVRVEMESVNFKETYSIGCHVMGEASHLTYLHSIVMFILLRYKETLLEARGFERSTLQSTDARRNESFENELVFSRWINISGYVRQYWPKAVSQKITSAGVAMRVSDSNKLPNDTDPDDALWIGDQDSLTVKLR